MPNRCAGLCCVAEQMVNVLLRRHIVLARNLSLENCCPGLIVRPLPVDISMFLSALYLHCFLTHGFWRLETHPQ